MPTAKQIEQIRKIRAIIKAKNAKGEDASELTQKLADYMASINAVEQGPSDVD